MRRIILAALAGCLLAAPTWAGEPPIPQDPARQERRFRDLIEWNRKTLGEAYETAGRKDPRWDKSAREALEAAARLFGRAIDPGSEEEEVYRPAKMAVDAGSDDALILYLHARTSRTPNDPGAEESERRWTRAAAAIEKSTYSPLRRAAALTQAGLARARKKILTPDDRREAARLLDAALESIRRGAAKPERGDAADDERFHTAKAIVDGHRLLLGDHKQASDRVDTVLAKVAGLKTMRLQLKAATLIGQAWEARGIGMGNTVTEDAGRKFEEALADAHEALTQAWETEPKGTRTPGLMLVVLKGLGGERADMEEWFRRALQADGSNMGACMTKMDWIDPKWYGSAAEVLEFGRACRATKNWRAGITLLAADAHLRVSSRMEPEASDKYLQSPEVWDEIRSVYEEYLAHYATDHAARSFYASYAYFCGRYVESDRQFKIVGNRLVANRFVRMDLMQELRTHASLRAKTPPPPGR